MWGEGVGRRSDDGVLAMRAAHVFRAAGAEERGGGGGESYYTIHVNRRSQSVNSVLCNCVKPLSTIVTCIVVLDE